MSFALVGAIAGLALVDSFNPATLAAVTLVLLAAPKRPGFTALMTVLGAATTVFVVGALLFLGASAAAGAVDGIVLVLRFAAFGAAGIGLVAIGIRRFKTRHRGPVRSTGWFTPWTAFPFGVLLTGVDLPNAFPYFIALERLIDARATTGQGLLVITGYAMVYCLPCVILLVVGLVTRARTLARLARITDRFGSGEVASSVPLGLVLIVSGIIVGTLPLWWL